MTQGRTVGYLVGRIGGGDSRRCTGLRYRSCTYRAIVIRNYRVGKRKALRYRQSCPAFGNEIRWSLLA